MRVEGIEDPLHLLERYIPAFSDLKVFAGVDAEGGMILEEPKRRPTLQDVFRHTAGFGYGFGDSPVDRAYAEAGINFATLSSLEELVQKLATVPLLYHPGERWVYSVAHDVQAYLVEHFSGLPFDEFLRQRMFEPLGMRDTVFGIPPEYVDPYTVNHARGDDGRLSPMELRDVSAASNGNFLGGYDRYTDVPFGGLGLSSTAADYALFGQTLVYQAIVD